MPNPFRLAAFALLAALCVGGAAAATGAGAPKEETLAQSVCRLIESSAQLHGLPVVFLTRLIWQESSFQPGAVSPAGAQGIAQFMPGTASDQGLANPFDPEEAIPKAAALLADLKGHFGNLGLAAAAYNAGSGRVGEWLAGSGSLPAETQSYVAIITRHSVDDWRGDPPPATKAGPVFPESTCLQEIAAVRIAQPLAVVATSSLTAPWGVQIAGSFSKAAALASFARARNLYAGILGNVEPMVIGGVLRTRGFSPFYRVRAPASTRAEAEGLCTRILRVGGACAVLRN